MLNTARFCLSNIRPRIIASTLCQSRPCSIELSAHMKNYIEDQNAKRMKMYNINQIQVNDISAKEYIYTNIMNMFSEKDGKINLGTSILANTTLFMYTGSEKREIINEFNLFYRLLIRSMFKPNDAEKPIKLSSICQFDRITNADLNAQAVHYYRIAGKITFFVFPIVSFGGKILFTFYLFPALFDIASITLLLSIILPYPF